MSHMPISPNSYHGVQEDAFIPEDVHGYGEATTAGLLQQLTYQNTTSQPPPSSAHHVVKHCYHDHANDTCEKVTEPVTKGGVTTPFPSRLHQMLEDDSFSSVVSWQPHGRCFVVHKQDEFVEKVMPKYFKQSKFPSFQRQLNLYGFSRLTKGPDKGGYYHELFLRGRSFLVHKIQRMKVKGTGVRARSNPNKEPNFYKMPPVGPEKLESLSKITDNKAVEQGDSPRTGAQISAKGAVESEKDTASSCCGEADGASTVPVMVESLSSAGIKHRNDDNSVDSFNLFEEDDATKDPPVVEKNSRPKDPERTARILRRLNISESLHQEMLRAVEDDESFGKLLEKLL